MAFKFFCVSKINYSIFLFSNKYLKFFSCGKKLFDLFISYFSMYILFNLLLINKKKLNKLKYVYEKIIKLLNFFVVSIKIWWNFGIKKLRKIKIFFSKILKAINKK